MSDDPTARVKTSYIGIDGPVNTYAELPRGDLRAIVSTVYRGDSCTDGPPFETALFRGRGPEPQGKTWTWEEADAKHIEVEWHAWQLVKAN